MFCSHCGSKLSEQAKYCHHCGTAVAQSSTTQHDPTMHEPANASIVPTSTQETPAERLDWPTFTPQPFEAQVETSFNQGSTSQGAATRTKAFNKTLAIPVAIGCVLALGVGALLFSTLGTSGGDNIAGPQTGAAQQDSIQEMPSAAQASTTRPTFFTADLNEGEQIVPQVEPYTIEPDLGNVVNKDYVHGYDATLLAKNGFYVETTKGFYRSAEYYDIYEMNRYSFYPSFVTTDSMMHTYHLYFAHLLKTTERDYLSPVLLEMSRTMLEESQAQLNAAQGSAWEEAALRNVAFFAVGISLLDGSFQAPAEVSDLVASEVEKVQTAGGVIDCSITGSQEDYTQYKPRGYYDGNETLERYFRAMMWYGRINFAQKNESLDRSAALMTLAMNGKALQGWEALYAVTSFFAGASDDNGYYEYFPAITSAWGNNVTAADITANEEGWAKFHEMTASMPKPAINSVVVRDSGTETDHEEDEKGFRFMGQRFSFDAAVFQNLIYNKVDTNAAGQKRGLPNALDIPAAMGSDEALAILEEMGSTEYAGYSENMTKLRESLSAINDTTWSSSLYNQWLYTLAPLLEPKTEGYPSFMQSKEWTRKNIQSYLGSYTELKHDTALYSKQAVAELGGIIPERDDRGYVEPEPAVFGRLALLTQATSEGLSRYGLIKPESVEDLKLLNEIALKLKEIAIKELQNEAISEEEYEFIRSFGGQIEHFWLQAWHEDITEEFPRSQDYPAAIVTDVATDLGTGTVLELGTGSPSEIFVVVPVEGTLRIARGAVFSFYQFAQPMDQRLTDVEWREMMALTSDTNYQQTPAHTPESWTQGFQGDIQ